MVFYLLIYLLMSRRLIMICPGQSPTVSLRLAAASVATQLVGRLGSDVYPLDTPSGDEESTYDDADIMFLMAPRMMFLSLLQLAWCCT
jgi:hypothetical protein